MSKKNSEAGKAIANAKTGKSDTSAFGKSGDYLGTYDTSAGQAYETNPLLNDLDAHVFGGTPVGTPPKPRGKK